MEFNPNSNLTIEEVFDPIKPQKPKARNIDVAEICSMNISTFDHGVDLQRLFRLFLLPATFESTPNEAKEFIKQEKTFIQDFDNGENNFDNELPINDDDGGDFNLADNNLDDFLPISSTNLNLVSKFPYLAIPKS